MPKILVVDDETDSRDAVVQFLESRGHQTLSAPNGQDALNHVISDTPDLVVLDWMMPQMDGVDFLKIVRSYLRLQHLPVILVTAYSGPHIDAARQLGVAGVFKKANYTFAELGECINQLCGQAAQGDSDDHTASHPQHHH